MDKKRFIFLTVGLLIFWFLAISIFRWQPKSDIRWLDDPNDKLVYMKRAAWVIEGGIPYKNVFSEYPQIPNYLFALPYILLSVIQPIETINSFQYTALFSLFMLATLASTVILLYHLLPKNKDRAFLLLLPASLYFSFNRFDILPSFFTLFSIALIYQKKMIGAAILLGIGTMTKWYPTLLLPIFLTYEFYRTGKFNWRMVGVFFLTIFLILLPTYLTGGWDAILVPYKAHFARSFELVSLPALVQRTILVPLDAAELSKYVSYLFLLLQFLPAMVSPLLKLNNKEKVVRWSIVSIGCFVIFSKIYSPQWLLWFMPLLILVHRTKRDIFFIVLYDFFIYLSFPIAVGIFGVLSNCMVLLNMLCLTILIFLVKHNISEVGERLSLENLIDFLGGIFRKQVYD